MVTLRGQPNAPIFDAIHPLNFLLSPLVPPQRAGALRQGPAAANQLQAAAGGLGGTNSQFQRRSGRGEQKSADCRPQHARWAQMDQERRGPINYGVRELENATPHCVPLKLLAEAL
ncbi:hypothetical protein MKX08_007053 [Trichoderma sp. CBMAI-0020]|nr:hypothetical protein MKX08_007053 [Trichoderma sp. CBMAI-0020]